MSSNSNALSVLGVAAACWLALGVLSATDARAQGGVIADSAVDFSGTQGQSNWFYGYYSGTQNPSGFAQYPTFASARSAWERSPSAWASQSPGYFTTTNATGGHPHAVAGGFTQVNSAVRRWVSPIAGQVRLEGSFRKTSDFFNGVQDGIVGRVFVNGVEVFSVDIPATDITARPYSVLTCLAVGSVVDVAVDPKSNEYSDGAEFSLQVRAAGPAIADGPLNGTSCPGGITAFGVNVTPQSGVTLTYRWQIQPEAGGPWQDLGSTPVPIPCPGGSGGTPGEATAGQATTATVLLRVRPCRGGNINPGAATTYGVRCIISNGCNSVTSNPVTFTVCPADFNCSGQTSVQDIFDFLSAWFASDVRADFNLAGGVSVQDIFDYLAAWFTGC